MKINNCKICGKNPIMLGTHVQKVKGCSVFLWIVECDGDTDEEPGYLEHRLSVYGKDKEEAIKRWNEINNDNEEPVKNTKNIKNLNENVRKKIVHTGGRPNGKPPLIKSDDSKKKEKINYKGFKYVIL
jgi:hypothetical protein